MKLKQLILAGAVAAISGSALAAGGFDGPFVQLGIGGSTTKTKISGTDIYNSTLNSGSFNGLVSAGYSQSIDAGGFNLAANLFYVIGNQNSGSATYSDQTSINSKLKNTFGISVEPGWNFTKETLGYIKLAWVNSRLNLNGSDSDGASSATGTVNGFGYGLGTKYKFTDNVFGAIDLMGVSYNSYSSGGGASSKPAQFIGFASIGYKF